MGEREREGQRDTTAPAPARLSPLTPAHQKSPPKQPPNLPTTTTTNPMPRSPTRARVQIRIGRLGFGGATAHPPSRSVGGSKVPLASPSTPLGKVHARTSRLGGARIPLVCVKILLTGLLGEALHLARQLGLCHRSPPTFWGGTCAPRQRIGHHLSLPLPLPVCFAPRAQSRVSVPAHCRGTSGGISMGIMTNQPHRTPTITHGLPFKGQKSA